MTFGKNFLRHCAVMAGIVLAGSSAAAPAPGQGGMPAAFEKPLNLTFCVYDPVGNNGDAATRARDIALEARKWNIITAVKVYTDERVASEDFKAGQREGLVITTLRA